MRLISLDFTQTTWISLKKWPLTCVSHTQPATFIIGFGILFYFNKKYCIFLNLREKYRMLFFLAGFLGGELDFKCNWRHLPLLTSASEAKMRKKSEEKCEISRKILTPLGRLFHCKNRKNAHTTSGAFWLENINFLHFSFSLWTTNLGRIFTPLKWGSIARCVLFFK